MKHQLFLLVSAVVFILLHEPSLASEDSQVEELKKNLAESKSIQKEDEQRKSLEEAPKKKGRIYFGFYSFTTQTSLTTVTQFAITTCFSTNNVACNGRRRRSHSLRRTQVLYDPDSL